ncbi:hypothetical protein A7M79_00380 [Acinetobacter baumannii]|uniref:pilin n=1 Tax=Acinetobacter baumannii TaxID=470 RepID=UPI0008DC949F|nr:pilin [Acinetobacter baumannii]OIH11980.1 hypothetical protein A7M79_00380 [Acinetobacter baumannii]
MKDFEKGFTLMELMVVIAIIGILAAVAFPKYQEYVAKSQITEAIALFNTAKIEATTRYEQDQTCFNPDPVREAGETGDYTKLGANEGFYRGKYGVLQVQHIGIIPESENPPSPCMYAYIFYTDQLGDKFGIPENASKHSHLFDEPTMFGFVVYKGGQTKAYVPSFSDDYVKHMRKFLPKTMGITTDTTSSYDPTT